MAVYDKEKDRALAEIYTYLLIIYESFKDGSISKPEFEKIKNSYLYDKNILKRYKNFLFTAPTYLIYADPNKTALDVLNNLIEEGVVTAYEYNTLKLRYSLI